MWYFPGIFIAFYILFSCWKCCHLPWVENVPTFFYGNYKGFLSKKSFERLPRGTWSGDEIGRFLCFGGKMPSENKDEKMQQIHRFLKGSFTQNSALFG